MQPFPSSAFSFLQNADCRSPTRKTQLNGSTFSPKRKPPSALLSHNSTAPPSPAPPSSSSTFVSTTHLSPSVLLSHNAVDTWVSTTGKWKDIVDELTWGTHILYFNG
ncbi:uncharacterized protein LOC126702311 [Quercus robur]|uniref:uncharacterized protein LOC126702311 n=1 Tax=Quercus robur TaxID=38942 RepID=UPI002162A380|nr:uncharacterized protein LOC126702311 [Quercus robur]